MWTESTDGAVLPDFCRHLLQKEFTIYVTKIRLLPCVHEAPVLSPAFPKGSVAHTCNPSIQHVKIDYLWLYSKHKVSMGYTRPYLKK